MAAPDNNVANPLAALLTRLEATREVTVGAGIVTDQLINPDGREAAAVIRRLLEVLGVREQRA